MKNQAHLREDFSGKLFEQCIKVNYKMCEIRILPMDRFCEKSNFVNANIKTREACRSHVYGPLCAFLAKELPQIGFSCACVCVFLCV